MRITHDYNEPTVEYEGQLPHGGSLLNCPWCAETQAHYSTPEMIGMREDCQNCGEELVLPGWAEW